MAKKNPKRLYRIEEGAKLFGVCGGVAEYFDLDPTLVRIGYAFLTIIWGTGLWLYLICALCMPKKSEI